MGYNPRTPEELTENQRQGAMTYNETVAERLRETFKSYSGVTERRMFGGLTFLLNGHMCCGVVRELMVRVGPDAYQEALGQPCAREMDFIGRPLKGLVYVASEGFESDQSLRGWVDRGARYALSLPAK